MNQAKKPTLVSEPVINDPVQRVTSANTGNLSITCTRQVSTSEKLVTFMVDPR